MLRDPQPETRPGIGGTSVPTRLTTKLADLIAKRNACAHTGTASPIPTGGDILDFADLLAAIGTAEIAAHKATVTPPAPPAAPAMAATRRTRPRWASGWSAGRCWDVAAKPRLHTGPKGSCVVSCGRSRPDARSLNSARSLVGAAGIELDRERSRKGSGTGE
jgi:hypothetical protein